MTEQLDTPVTTETVADAVVAGSDRVKAIEAELPKTETVKESASKPTTEDEGDALAKAVEQSLKITDKDGDGKDDKEKKDAAVVETKVEVVETAEESEKNEEEGDDDDDEYEEEEVEVEYVVEEEEEEEEEEEIEEIEENRVRIYGSSVSGNRKYKSNYKYLEMQLNSLEIPFDFIDCAVDEQGKAYLRRKTLGKMTMPAVFVDGEFICGYEDFLVHVEHDDLIEYLGLDQDPLDF
ncbi:hypothetical protein GQ42DRAFT_164042 [Ramicandelaber brevisporus]|nr:hypothetical protein GQ42DRAFT_164042 [Ramicandelaber brevisporus]